MNYDTLQLDINGAIAIVTLNRPERMNTLGGSMKEDLHHVFTERIRNDESIRAVVIIGTGERAFCAGADIKERVSRALTLPAYHAGQKATHQLFSAIEAIEVPVIAAINGVALGGGLELALCADLRIAAEHAKLGLPEARLGALPAAGGTQRLPRMIGTALAKQLMFTCEHITAARALSIGLVNEVVPLTDLLPRALELANQISANAPLSIRFIKQAINQGMRVDLESGLEYERYAAAIVVSSEDRKEGMRAFVEKRTPQFQGV
ncbi:enoyl-CoA hydratase/isomerase family protein [Bordetella muralis]|uniref:enoyl-CoA hydratase/isomerase family protein n=1 Tax=Bordetella muralis TaxID=1649130 RepID=UPI0039EDF490